MGEDEFETKTQADSETGRESDADSDADSDLDWIGRPELSDRDYRKCYREYCDCLEYGRCLGSAGGTLGEDEDMFDYDGTEYCSDYVW